MKITMAHGSGGISSAELMRTIFGKHFANPILDKMEDGAVLNVSKEIAVSTDSFVVTPLFFKGGDIGKLAVCGTVNDLLMMGSSPKYLTCGFILEEGLDTDDLDKIVVSMSQEAAKAGVLIVAGDTKVVEGEGGMYINTTGIGFIQSGIHISALNCKEGDILILSGTLGNHHSCILSSRMDIKNNIVSDCACLSDVTEALFAQDTKVRAMRDVTRGGLATILNEIAEASCCEIRLSEEAIPVDEEVAGFAGILGMDPLYMGNEGKMVAIVEAQGAEATLERIKATKNGKNAAIIGKVCKGKGVNLITSLGGIRVLDPLYGEGLPRIC